MVELASKYGRYGNRRITAMLRGEGWKINHNRVERFWRQEGLKVPSRQPKRKRLWLTDGSCVRLRPTNRNHVWSYDFRHERTEDGRAFRLLTIQDESTRECLGMDVARRMSHRDVMDRLAGLFIERGVPECLRSDNGPEFTAQVIRDWLKAIGVRTVCDRHIPDAAGRSHTGPHRDSEHTEHIRTGPGLARIPSATASHLSELLFSRIVHPHCGG